MNYLILLVGVVCAGIGGELFVRGAVGLALWFRIAPAIVGATIAAFATSSPELSVSLRAAAEGQPQISLGDALGSNVVNVALILGLALLFAPIKVTSEALKREFPFALAIPLLTSLLFLDGVLSRIDGMLLLALFTGWLYRAFADAKKHRDSAVDVVGSGNGGASVLYCLTGLAFLTAAGFAIVSGARAIAHSYGITEFVIGATIVAIGTSVPELATTLVSRFRGHDEIGLGTVLGSNVFNGGFIVPVAALICPIVLDWRATALACGLGLVALLVAFPFRKGLVIRAQGAILLLVYAAYLAIIFTVR